MINHRCGSRWASARWPRTGRSRSVLDRRRADDLWPGLRSAGGGPESVPSGRLEWWPAFCPGTSSTQSRSCSSVSRTCRGFQAPGLSDSLGRFLIICRDFEIRWLLYLKFSIFSSMTRWNTIQRVLSWWSFWNYNLLTNAIILSHYDCTEYSVTNESTIRQSIDS